MSAAFTPGPWRVTDAGVRDDGGYICLINKPSRYPGQNERHEKETVERQANAQLIAAAPDLLAACELIVRAFDALKPASAARNEPLQINAARAAIEKATGGAA